MQRLLNQMNQPQRIKNNGARSNGISAAAVSQPARRRGQGDYSGRAHSPHGSRERGRELAQQASGCTR